MLKNARAEKEMVGGTRRGEVDGSKKFYTPTLFLQVHIAGLKKNKTPPPTYPRRFLHQNLGVGVW